MAKVTKAQQVRDIIAANPRKDIDALLEQVMKKTGLSKSLAKVYLRNNAAKLKTGSKKKVSKAAAKKTGKGTSKRAKLAKKSSKKK